MYDYVIKKLRTIQIEILNEFDNLCKKHKLSYQLFAGTLLGAVRHKGYIPWDDDIDICMPRKDYEKFKKIAFKEIDDKYLLQLPGKEDSIFSYVKIRKKNTEMIEGTIKNIDINHGIFIDIFPLDNVFPKTIRGRIQQIKMNWLFRIRETKKDLYHKNIIKRIIKRIIFNIYRKNYTYYNKKIDQEAMRYLEKNTEYMALLVDAVTNRNYNGTLYNKKDFENHVNIEFEDGIYPGPNRYDEILTQLYGDYMKLPSKKAQKSHHGLIKVSFDDEAFRVFEENGELKAEYITKK